MDNPEEILHSLEEFAKLKPKDIPRELEDYLCFVAKTGDPIYQWSIIKSLFREKLISVITEFYEACPTVEIPPCPNVDLFNYDAMKCFILEKLDTFVAAPFTVQRICELLTSPRKEYNRIDKYMRALEKNILVVSTTEPGNHRTPENGDGFVNGIEIEHLHGANNVINVEAMDDTPICSDRPTMHIETPPLQSTSKNDMVIDSFSSDSNAEQEPITSNIETVITCCPTDQSYVSIEPVAADEVREETAVEDTNVSVTITAIPAAVQKRRDSIEPPQEQQPSKTETATEKKVAEPLEESPAIIEETTKIAPQVEHVDKEIINDLNTTNQPLPEAGDAECKVEMIENETVLPVEAKLEVPLKEEQVESVPDSTVSEEITDTENKVEGSNPAIPEQQIEVETPTFIDENTIVEEKSEIAIPSENTSEAIHVEQKTAVEVITTDSSAEIADSKEATETVPDQPSIEPSQSSEESSQQEMVMIMDVDSTCLNKSFPMNEY